MIKAILGFCLGSVTAVAAETYPLTSDSLPQPGVPQGTVTHAVLPPGNIYPGTPHNYAVYVPAGAKADRPLPYMVFLDGSGALKGLHVPVVLDNLIAKHELPPMAGIFVDPGIMPTMSPQAQHRYGRIYEYDSINSHFADFLDRELIPAVAKVQALSTNPDDHGIAGVSTGAVGAFVAAWRRPDHFHRVLSLIGTFVDMKGAEELPSLVRKTEPKPLRILLQDGRNDHLAPDLPWGTFYAGSWPINNQVMYEALEFAGYDAKLVVGDGAHDTKQGAAVMPEALRWLWADYPKPIVVHEPASMSSPHYDPRGRAYSIVSADHPWELVSGSIEVATNAAGDALGNVYFADEATGRILRVNPAGQTTPFSPAVGRSDLNSADAERVEGNPLHPGSGISALRVGPDGHLYASTIHRRLVAFDSDGTARVVADGIAADDFAISRGGVIYFTDDHQHNLGMVKADGTVVPKLLASSGLPAGAFMPWGISLSPDQAMLIVSDQNSRFARSYQISPDGTPRDEEAYYRLYGPEEPGTSGALGVAVDAIGQVYFATPEGIQVTEQNGRVSAVLNGPGPGSVRSVVFAGKDLKWLYATSGGRLYRRPTKIPGVAAWTLVTPPTPPL